MAANLQFATRAGTIVTGYRVKHIKPSADVVPWPVQGTLWEAAVSVKAVQGTVTPILTDFNARADDGQTYQMLPVATPQGISPATLSRAAGRTESCTSTSSASRRTVSSTTLVGETCFFG